MASSSQKLLRFFAVADQKTSSLLPFPGRSNDVGFCSLLAGRSPGTVRTLGTLRACRAKPYILSFRCNRRRRRRRRPPSPTRNPEPNTLKTLTKIFQLFATLSPQPLLGTIYVEKRCSKSTLRADTQTLATPPQQTACVVGDVLSSSSWVRIRRSKTSNS